MAAAGTEVLDLETRVRPPPHLVRYWNAFSELSTDRPVGIGVGPIPWTSIDRYATRYGFDSVEDFDLLKRFVRLLDGVFLKDHGERHPSPK